MAPKSRNNPSLKRRIARLHLSLGRRSHSNAASPMDRDLLSEIDLLRSKLHPLYPQPGGPPHPKFPKTIMHWLLLTEDELDSIAQYYGQTTPNTFTNTYPAPMGWDKDFLARPEETSPQLMPWNDQWLSDYGFARRASSSSSSSNSSTSTLVAPSHGESEPSSPTIPTSDPASRSSTSRSVHTLSNNHRRQRHEPLSSSPPESEPPYPETPLPLSTTERVAIKRRKLGKFMGLRGCDTPVDEMERRTRTLEARLERSMRNEMSRRDDFDRSGDGLRGPPKFGKGML